MRSWKRRNEEERQGRTVVSDEIYVIMIDNSPFMKYKGYKKEIST